MTGSFTRQLNKPEIHRLCNLPNWVADNPNISTNWHKNRGRHQLNDSKVGEIQAIFINSKSVIRWQEPLTLLTFFTLLFFSDRASHLLTN